MAYLCLEKVQSYKRRKAYECGTQGATDVLVVSQSIEVAPDRICHDLHQVVRGLKPSNRRSFTNKGLLVERMGINYLPEVLLA